jgi:hypothetical protein
MPERIVRLEEDYWRIRSPEGELAAEEQAELRAYFDEIRLPYRLSVHHDPGSQSLAEIPEETNHCSKRNIFGNHYVTSDPAGWRRCPGKHEAFALRFLS